MQNQCIKYWCEIIECNIYTYIKLSSIYLKCTLNENDPEVIIFSFQSHFQCHVHPKHEKGCFLSVIQLIDSIIGRSDTFSHDFFMKEKKNITALSMCLVRISLTFQRLSSKYTSQVNLNN